MPPLVCLLVISYNGKKWLDICMPTFLKTSYPNYKIILIDNGSADGTFEYAKKKFPEVDVFRVEPNQGFAGGNNRGIEYASKKYTPDYFVLLNNDMEAKQPTWLNKMVELAEASKNIGIVGCKLLFPSGKIQHAGGFIHPLKIVGHIGLNEEDAEKYSKVYDVDYVTGACFLIKKSVIEKMGLLNESYNPYYFEETEYCLRAKKNGFRVVYAGNAVLIHHTSATTGTDNNDKKYFIWEKNRLRFISRNFSIFWKVPAYLRVGLNVFIEKTEKGFVLSKNPARKIKLLADAFKESI